MYTIYGTPTCGYCREAKKLLDSLNIEYKYIDITLDPKHVEEYKRLFPGKTSVPQILHLTEAYGEPFTNVVGGYNELKEYLKNA